MVETKIQQYQHFCSLLDDSVLNSDVRPKCNIPNTAPYTKSYALFLHFHVFLRAPTNTYFDYTFVLSVYQLVTTQKHKNCCSSTKIIPVTFLTEKEKSSNPHFFSIFLCVFYYILIKNSLISLLVNKQQLLFCSDHSLAKLEVNKSSFVQFFIVKKMDGHTVLFQGNDPNITYFFKWNHNRYVLYLVLKDIRSVYLLITT